MQSVGNCLFELHFCFHFQSFFVLRPLMIPVIPYANDLDVIMFFIFY